MTPSKMENNAISQCMVIMGIVDTEHYYLCIWRPFSWDNPQLNYCFYDKSTGKLYNSVGLVDDLWGLPSVFPKNYYVMDGREYLELGYPVYKLMDAWAASDNPRIRKQAESIDDEGNNVLIRIRLKK